MTEVDGTIIADKPCPFCGGIGEIDFEESENPNEGYQGTEYFIVRCRDCSAKSGFVTYEYFNQFTPISVEMFRKNNALRSREEDRYDEYLAKKRNEAVALWNNRK